MNVGAIAILPRSVAGLVFDATFEEVHTSEMEVTDNPVERGAPVSDHAFIKPYKLRITAGVSNTPLGPVPADFGDGENRIRVAFEKLRQLQATREPFSINTGLALYQNMVCTLLTVPQDKDSAHAIVFTADFREVRIVDTQVVTYPPRKKGKTKNQADQKKDKGEQQGKEQKDAPKQSALKRLAAALGKG